MTVTSGTVTLAGMNRCCRIARSDAGEVPDLTALQRRFMPTSVTVPDVTVTIPAAMDYDALLSAPQMGLPS